MGGLQEVRDIGGVLVCDIQVMTLPPLSTYYYYYCSPAYGELSHYYLEFKRPKVSKKR